MSKTNIFGLCLLSLTLLSFATTANVHSNETAAQVKAKIPIGLLETKARFGWRDEPFDLCKGWEKTKSWEEGFAQCDEQPVLQVKRDHPFWKKLSRPLKGIMEFEALVKPATDSNTNFVLVLSHVDPIRENADAPIIIHVNETNRWFYGTTHQLYENCELSANVAYSMDWTNVKIRIHTEKSTYSLWIDNKLVRQDIPTQVNISEQGIQSIGVWSGRGGEGHSSYIASIKISRRSPGIMGDTDTIALLFEQPNLYDILTLKPS